GRGAAACLLGPEAAPSTQPQGKSPAQLRAPPARAQARPPPPTRAGLPGAPGGGRQEQTRGSPLPKAPPRPRRLSPPEGDRSATSIAVHDHADDADRGSRLDIGETLAAPTFRPAGFARGPSE